MNNFLKDIFGLDGKVALVTGSSRGIGAAIAQGLAKAGADVVVHGQYSESAEMTANKIRKLNRKSWVQSCDLSVKGAGKKLIEESEKSAGQIDILVVNASVQINAKLELMEESDLDHHYLTNLYSMVEMLQVCLPRMSKRGWGRIVNVGSINQTRPKSIVTAYAAMKAAQHNIINSQAQDYAKSGVLMNTIAPGLIDTDRNLARKNADKEKWEDYVRNLNWMGRIGLPEEIVGAAIFLSSNACSFMTGETIYITGGY